MTGSFVLSILVGVTVVMAAALGVTSVLRRRRAATRHVLLTAAFAVALALPAATAFAPYVTRQVPVPAPAVVASAVATFDAGTSPLPLHIVSAPATPPIERSASIPFGAVIEGLWLLGFVSSATPVAVGLFQVRALGRRGVPWPHGRGLTASLAASLGLRRRIDLVVLHEAVSSPMTYGTLRPTIVLPVDAKTWGDDGLTRAIVHELEHIRRADWLTQCLSRTLCAVYWFHPLVWITRRRLVLEAERAADDGVLKYAEASAYADQLVDLARRLSSGHQPFLAMANRRDLAARVHALLDGRQPRGRAGAWLVAGCSCLAAGLVLVLSPLRIAAQSPKPHFDIVSVRSCDPNAAPVVATGGGRGGTSQGLASPGRLRLDCRSVSDMIVDAYATFAGGRYTAPSARPAFDRWHTGPDWIRSERFTIEATTDGATPLAVMRGPMLQAALEDRFKLETHDETREVPVLELVVARGGSKLKPFVPGTCVPYDYSVFPLPPVQPGQRRCLTRTDRGSNDNWVEIVEATTLDDWVTHFDSRAMAGEPPIVNRTGITGLQTFRYEYSGRFSDMPAEFKSQLGLELQPAQGAQRFLLLDHVERPVLDDGAALPSAPRPSPRVRN